VATVAQEFAPPGERMIKLEGKMERPKTDVRLYIYDGQILLTAARLKPGQTTNLGTLGGGSGLSFPSHPAQQDSCVTSLLNVCAASFSPSTIVRYGKS
jgi:hypothetical protein